MLQLSRNIRKYRKIKGFTQHEMADKLDVPRTTYATWETGTEPKGSILQSISNILEIPVMELYKGDIHGEDTLVLSDPQKPYKKVFISHAEADTPVVDKLIASLEKQIDYKDAINELKTDIKLNFENVQQLLIKQQAHLQALTDLVKTLLVADDLPLKQQSFDQSRKLVGEILSSQDTHKGSGSGKKGKG